MFHQELLCNLSLVQYRKTWYSSWLDASFNLLSWIKFYGYEIYFCKLCVLCLLGSDLLSFSQSAPVVYRSKTIFEDATPELVRDFFWDDEFRCKWDNMLAYYKILEEFPQNGTMVVHWIKKVCVY